MFRKANTSKVGGKFLIFGGTGTGKSLFGLTAPASIAVDSEAGLSHYEGIPVTLNNGKTYNNLKFVDTTNDLDTLEDDMEDFVSIAEENNCQTFIIDSETKIYAGLQIAANEVEERRARRKGGDVDDASISLKQWSRIKLINLRLQQAKIDLSSKGYHIISIAQEVETKDDNGKVTGYKPDVFKSLVFDYDVIARFFNKKEKDGQVHYYAEILKDRTNVTHIGDIIENPCFDIWADYFNGRSNLSTNETTYKNDIKTSTESLVEDADKAESLATELKDLMKKLKESSNMDAIKTISGLMKDKGIDIKKLDLASVEDLTELVDYAKLQA